MRLIPVTWETEELLVRDALPESDLERLQAIWEGTAYIGAFDGHPERNSADMRRQLSEGDLPPAGTIERFRIQPLFSQGTCEMVGYATLYHGYPDDGTLWVTFFCVDRSGQRQVTVGSLSKGWHGKRVARGFAGLCLPWP